MDKKGAWLSNMKTYRVHVWVESHDPVYGDGMEGVIGRHIGYCEKGFNVSGSDCEICNICWLCHCVYLFLLAFVDA